MYINKHIHTYMYMYIHTVIVCMDSCFVGMGVGWGSLDTQITQTNLAVLHCHASAQIGSHRNVVADTSKSVNYRQQPWKHAIYETGVADKLDACCWREWRAPV